MREYQSREDIAFASRLEAGMRMLSQAGDDYGDEDGSELEIVDLEDSRCVEE